MEWGKEESSRQEVNAISGAVPDYPESSDQMQRDAWGYNCADAWL
jgi:hypothetical protein